MRRQLRRSLITLGLISIPFLASASPAFANDPPTCQDVTYTVFSGVPFSLPLNTCSDPDGPGPISYSLASQPSHGTATFSYTSNAGYTGPDSFTYRGSDGLGAQSAPATVSLNVVPAPPNNAPTCQNVSYTVYSGVPFSLPLNTCSDPDGPIPLSYNLASQPSHGSVTFSYTSHAGYTGPDSFTYTGRDGLGATSAPATITLNVLPVPPNDPPTCPGGGPLSVGPDRAIHLPICDDDQSEPLIYEGSALHGSVFAFDGRPAYRPTAGYTGPDTVTYRARDKWGVYSEFATVEILVDPLLPPNRPPACPDSDVFVPLGGSVVLRGNCADPDGDLVTYGLSSFPTAGDLQILSQTSVRYTPNGSSLSDTFQYSGSDGASPGQLVTVRITVLPAGSSTFPPTPEEPSAEQPFVPSVEVPTTGSVSIDVRSTTVTPPTGYNLLDQEFDITYEGPDGTVEEPLRITFAVDASITAPSIVPIRNGIPVPPCTGSAGQASPNPCYEPVVGSVGSDRSITVLTTHASLWTLGVPLAPPRAFDFGGFMAPVNGGGTLNRATAGQAIPVKFSLGADEGLAIFDGGSPDSRPINCATGAESDPVETTVTAGSSSLSYDAATDTYTYVWKTQKAWAGTCRRLVLDFADEAGSIHTADFSFKAK